MAEQLESSPSASKSAEDRVSRNPCDILLHCHFFFSSPLCVNRSVIVRLPCNFPKTALEFDKEVESWHLDFESLQPSIVRYVRPGGLLSQWNEEQEHHESLVRPGDELLWLSMDGVRETVNGRSLAICLQKLCEQVQDLRSKRIVSESEPPPHVELIFRALRALKPLQVADELALLRQSGCKVTSSAATAHNMRGLIAAATCEILHISLHCSAAQEQLLFLEDGHGKAHVIKAMDIKTILSQGTHRQNVRLVVLNACHSLAIGLHFINAGVRHVICVRDDDEVRDESCCLFARDLFAALRAGRSVQEAFDCGRAVLACSQEPHLRKDAGSFLLLPENGDHSACFAPDGGAQFAPRSVVAGGPWGTTFSKIEDFLGREIDVHKLLHSVRSRRFIEMQGEIGIGKSALLSETGQFLMLRRNSSEEVRYINLRNADDNAQQEILNGLEGLRRRLADDSSQQQAFLLIDDPDMVMWSYLQPLLRYGGIHMVLVSKIIQSLPMAESDASAGSQVLGGISLAAKHAVEAGLKPVSFEVGPLDSLSQVRLLLRRAPRPLNTAELECRRVESHDPIVPPPARPVDFIRLAEKPIFAQCRGNPAQIVKFAATLSLLPIVKNVKVEARAYSADASAGLSRQSSHAIAARRPVRLVRPDGRCREEWLHRSLTIGRVLKEHCPQCLRGNAVAFIAGCHAPDDAILGDFPDSQCGMLVLEFRSSSSQEDDW